MAWTSRTATEDLGSQMKAMKALLNLIRKVKGAHNTSLTTWELYQSYRAATHGIEVKSEEAFVRVFVQRRLADWVRMNTRRKKMLAQFVGEEEVRQMGSANQDQLVMEADSRRWLQEEIQMLEQGRLDAALDVTLKDPQKVSQTLRLVYMEENTYEEVARKMGCVKATVHNRVRMGEVYLIHRAKKEGLFAEASHG